MTSGASLTCNFTISTSLNLGVSFQSADGGANYGGQITISTPYSAGPVTTGLWDNDGNVFFTLYNVDAPASCTINSGSVPGSWTPFVEVGQEAGLACVVTGPQQTGPDTYDYTLTVTAVPAADKAAASAQHVATMTIPAGGAAAWTAIMQGDTPAPARIDAGSPIVMAWARFDDGTQVAGGVRKSDTPDYNLKFMWVLDANGNQYPGWPIDVSDNEDFGTGSYQFTLTPDGTEIYLLDVVESTGPGEAG